MKPNHSKYTCKYLFFILTMISSIGFSNSILCQSTVSPLKKLTHNKVLYNGDSLKYFEMDHVFNKVMILKKNYDKSVMSLKTAKWQGMTSLGLIGGGLVLAAVAEDDDCIEICVNNTQVVGWVSAFIIGPIIGTSALFFEMNGRKKQKRVLSIYNANYDDFEEPAESYIKITNSRYGLGLSLSYTF